MIRLGHLAPPPRLEPTGPLARLDPHVLTRHAVCLGATGSGKTGFCISLLEELAAQGVPILALDPKGDLVDLALTFPELLPDDFLAWIDGAEAARLGTTPEVLAARTAEAWRQGLAAAGLGPDDVAAFRARVDVIVMTPGSDAGTPVDVLATLTRAPRGLQGDVEGMREFVTGAVGALLGLIGRSSNPLTDPATLLLERLFGDAFAAGRDLPPDVLLPAVVDPPFDSLGYFPLDAFFPRRERMELALRLDAVLSSPSFAAWRQGEPLDPDAWLAPRDGRTPLRVLYLAHLDDAQRLFFVTLLLHAVVAWTRRQPGTSALRALLAFDEVFGYLPPHPKDPPSKRPLLTLLKQARSVGFGVMLATQNPVDLDYKALSSAGVWLIGLLPMRQDRARVIEGLRDALGSDAEVERLIAELPGRTFVVREAGGEVRVVRSRQTMAYLRGPLTRREVARLVGSSGAATPARRWLRAPPPAPGGVPVCFLPADAAARLGLEVTAEATDEGVPHVPALHARLRLRFDEPGWVDQHTRSLLFFPLDVPVTTGRAAALHGATPVAPSGAVFSRLPGWIDRDVELTAWVGEVLAETLRSGVAERWRHPASELVSEPGEGRAAFAARVREEGGDEGGIVADPVGLERGDVVVEGVTLVWVAGR